MNPARPFSFRRHSHYPVPPPTPRGLGCGGPSDVGLCDNSSNGSRGTCRVTSAAPVPHFLRCFSPARSNVVVRKALVPSGGSPRRLPTLDRIHGHPDITRLPTQNAGYFQNSPDRRGGGRHEGCRSTALRMPSAIRSNGGQLFQAPCMPGAMVLLVGPRSQRCPVHHFPDLPICCPHELL